MKHVGPLKWHHVTITAYGWWLPGDPRGFRTKQHREHVEGDYKSPPTADYSERLKRSRDLLRHPPVPIAVADRPLVTRILLRTLDYHGLDAACIATAATHAHLLCKLPTGKPKAVVGVLKREVSLQLRDRYALPFWAGRCHHVWASDCGHWSNVMRYVARHADRGGALWVWDGPQTVTARTVVDAVAIRERRIAERVAAEGERWFERPPVPTKGSGEETPKPRV